MRLFKYFKSDTNKDSELTNYAYNLHIKRILSTDSYISKIKIVCSLLILVVNA